MKKIMRIMIVILVMACVVLFVPTKGTKPTEEQKQEMATYILDITQLNKEQKRITGIYKEKVVEEENKQVAYEYLEKAIIPEYKKYVKKVENIKIKDAQIKHVHQKYSEAVTLQMSVYDDYVKAYQKQEEELYNKANKNVTISNEWFERHDEALRQLAKEYEQFIPKKTN